MKIITKYLMLIVTISILSASIVMADDGKRSAPGERLAPSTRTKKDVGPIYKKQDLLKMLKKRIDPFRPPPGYEDYNVR